MARFIWAVVSDIDFSTMEAGYRWVPGVTQLALWRRIGLPVARSLADPKCSLLPFNLGECEPSNPVLVVPSPSARSEATQGRGQDRVGRRGS